MTRLLTLMLALSVMAADIEAQPRTTYDVYTLNAGDTIRIHVYGEEDLTFQHLLIGQMAAFHIPFWESFRLPGKVLPGCSRC